MLEERRFPGQKLPFRLTGAINDQLPDLLGSRDRRGTKNETNLMKNAAPIVLVSLGPVRPLLGNTECEGESFRRGKLWRRCQRARVTHEGGSWPRQSSTENASFGLARNPDCSPTVDESVWKAFLAYDATKKMTW